MWYKMSPVGSLDQSQSTRVTDGQADGRTDGQNYDSQISTVDVINIAADRQKFMTLTGELS